MGQALPVGVLIAQNDGCEGIRHRLVSDETLIGRNPHTDITLLDEGISREHAIVLRDESHYVIEDLQSTNGTKVNGKRVRSAELHPGDLIEIGHSRFLFELEPAGSPTPPAEG